MPLPPPPGEGPAACGEALVELVPHPLVPLSFPRPLDQRQTPRLGQGVGGQPPLIPGTCQCGSWLHGQLEETGDRQGGGGRGAGPGPVASGAGRSGAIGAGGGGLCHWVAQSASGLAKSGLSWVLIADGCVCYWVLA